MPQKRMTKPNLYYKKQTFLEMYIHMYLFTLLIIGLIYSVSLLNVS